jgi:hypothetical protein
MLLSEQQSEVQKLSSVFQSLDNRIVRIASKEDVDVEQEILNWVCHYNYQAQHHRAWKLHCDNTSAWILEHQSPLSAMDGISQPGPLVSRRVWRGKDYPGFLRRRASASVFRD